MSKSIPQDRVVPPQHQSSHALQTDSDWCEEKVTDSLRRLDDLHRKLVGLRSVIPKVIPFTTTTHYAAPAEVFHHFSARAISCQEQIAAFSNLYTKSQPVFEHAAASRAAKPDGIERISPYEMFLPDDAAVEEPQVKLKQEDGDGDIAMAEEKKESEEADKLDSDVGDVLQAFRETNADIKVDENKITAEGKRKFDISLPPPAALLFALEITTQASAAEGSAEAHSRRFVITSVKNAKRPEAPAQHLHISLLRNITVRPSAGSLKLLLDMLASYRNIFSECCENCGKLTAGTRVELPVARNLVKNDNDKGKRWVALHEPCL